MKTTNDKQAQELFEKLITRAWDDASFKEQFIQNPEATIAEVAGTEFKSDSKIVVVDQTDPGVTYINIPAKPDVADLELSEEQLEAVSGGDGFWETIGYYFGVSTRAQQTVMVGLINAQAEGGSE